MELLFNIVWLVVAVGLSVFLALHNRARTVKPSTFVIVVAVTCIVFLLFPPISISDDLHNANLAMEDSSQKCFSLISLPHLAVLQASAFVALVWIQPPQSLHASMGSEVAQSQTLDGFISPAKGRAPPLASRVA